MNTGATDAIVKEFLQNIFPEEYVTLQGEGYNSWRKFGGEGVVVMELDRTIRTPEKRYATFTENERTKLDAFIKILSDKGIQDAKKHVEYYFDSSRHCHVFYGYVKNLTEVAAQIKTLNSKPRPKDEKSEETSVIQNTSSAANISADKSSTAVAVMVEQGFGVGFVANSGDASATVVLPANQSTDSQLQSASAPAYKQ